MFGWLGLLYRARCLGPEAALRYDLAMPLRTIVSRTIEFDAGHRLVGHESKCANLHGHRYKLLVIVDAGELDPVGRVVDFSVIKERVGGWVDEHWDHTFIVNQDDPAIELLRKAGGNKPIFELAANPTAEHMAEFMLGKAQELLADTGVRVCAITLYETPNCYAHVVAHPY